MQCNKLLSSSMMVPTSDFPLSFSISISAHGLSISLTLSVTQSLNWTVRMASDMESQMVSVERVKTYSVMQQVGL